MSNFQEQCQRYLYQEKVMLTRHNLFSAWMISACCLIASQQILAQDPNQLPPELVKKVQEFQERGKKQAQTQMMLHQLLSITNNAELAKELQLVDEQLEKLRPLVEEYMKRMRETSAENQENYRKISEFVRAGKQQEAIELNMKVQEESMNTSEESFKKIEQILLPHQINRIQQLGLQQKVKLQSPYYGMLGMPLMLSEELELTDEQQEKLEKATKEADAEMRKAIEKLSDRLMKHVLESLPKEKREEYKEIIGDLYDADAARNRLRFSSTVPAEKPEKKD
jgi:phytoene dehydrogenase-like protein